MNPAPASTPHFPSGSAARWLAGLIGDWLASEGQRWIFVAKAMLAAYSALWLAFRLGLDSPSTALTTTFILALPSSGMVLEKGFYRLLGTLVGCAAALLMLALFPQQPVPLFLALALWVGLCTSGAATHRNQQSYSFVLAGYTACMIAIPAMARPADVFALAVTRVSEVGLGIVCAAVVHDALFPRHQSQQVLRTVQARYAGFVDFCGQVLAQRLTPAETELHHLRYAADIAALESGRAAAFFEAAHARWQTRQLHAFNNAFMSALTTCYTLHRLIHRLRGAPAAAALAQTEPLLTWLAGALRQDLSGHHMEQVRAELALRAAAARRALGRTGRAQHIDFDTAVELLERHARDMAAFAALYHGLAQRRRLQISDPVAYSPRTPPAIALASGARAACALLAGALIWYWLAWPQAASAIVMTTIFCALASSSPKPTAMVRQLLTGFLLAWPLSFVLVFCLVIRASGFPMLVLATLPLFALGSYLGTHVRHAGVGVGCCLFAAQVAAPLNQMRYDGAAFLNTTLALPLGVVLAYLIFAVVLPEHTMGQKDHVGAALWREALATCRAPLHRLKHGFDHRVRDLLSQLNAASGPAPDAAARAVVRQALTLLEQGHAVIELRQLIAVSRPGPARDALVLCIARLAAYFRAPGGAGNTAVHDALLRAGQVLRRALAGAAPARAASLQTALTDLHSIHTSLLDQLPQVTGARDHAA